METNNFFWHRIFLCTLFTVGNAVITLPIIYGENISLFAFLIASVLGVLFAAAFTVLLKNIGKISIPNLLKKALRLIFILILIYLFLECSRDYVLFTDTTKMPNTSAAVIAVVFSVLSIYCGFKRRPVLLRLSVICFLICAVILLTLLLLSLPLIDIKSIPSNYTTNGVFLVFLKVFLPNTAVFYYLSLQKNGVLTSVIGTALGNLFLMVSVFICSCVLNLALPLINYPLSTLGGIISIGKGFTRFEGFIYLFTMLTSFIKASMILSLIKEISLSLNKKFFKTVAVLIPILSMAVAILH